MVHHMRNLPTMMVLAERSVHRGVRLSTRCLLCDSSPKMARQVWECPVQSHEWRPSQQRLHMWLTTCVGPRALQVQGQLWDSTVLEQWLAAIATPSLQAAHMGLASHDIRMEFIRQLLSQKVWLATPRPRK